MQALETRHDQALSRIVPDGQGGQTHGVAADHRMWSSTHYAILLQATNHIPPLASSPG